MPDSALARLGEELARWKELLGGTIIAFLALIWRLGRKEQQRENRVEGLEKWRNEHSDFSDANTQRIDDIAQHLCRQDVKLARIGQQVNGIRCNVNDMREDIRALSGLRQPGGKRWKDPPMEASRFCVGEDEEDEDAH